jgi:hypothetical protein
VRARQLRFGGAHTLTQWLTGNDRARQRRSISKVCARSERLLVSVSHSQSCDKYREMEESIRNHGTRQQMNDGYIWGSKEPCTVHRSALTTPKGCSLCTWQTHTSMSLESNRLEGVVTGCGRHQLPQSKKRIDRQEANVIPSGLVSYPSGKKTGSKRITEES